jgi:hypothetical protein
MSIENYTCTLNRWHKVSERLSKEFSSLSKTAKEGLTTTSVSEYLGQQQIERLEQFRASCLEQLDKALQIQDVIARIRQALAEANERTGVSRELAEYDKLTKRASLLNAICEAQTANLIRLDELENVKNPPRSEDWRDRGQAKIPVALLHGEALAAMNRRAQETTAAMYALADRIADLNKTQVSIELPEEIARLAGL